jgi:outer membrane lipoprotein SlyB
MKSTTSVKTFVTVLAALTLGACANAPFPGTPSGSGATSVPATSPGTVYSGYGVVQSIELVRQNNTGTVGGIGVGTIAGAVVGGLIGNQMGQGQGKTAATVVGAAGGAYVGHELDKQNQQSREAYKLTIQMSDGSYQTVTQTTDGDIRVGERVRISNGVARRY